uniref:Potassium channel domain-containing protein n=1 Tax=Wuchereria bancrofti TaxID=6293 RepID=A0AAF5PVW1_WUCBA
MLASWLRIAGSKMGPIFLRILLITIVSIYAIFGALILSHLETKEQVDHLSNVQLHNDITQISTHSRIILPIYMNHWNGTRQCITDIIKNLLRKSNCSNIIFDHLSIHYFKHCYYYNLLSHSNVTNNEQRNDNNNYLSTSNQSSNYQDSSEIKKDSPVNEWPFIDSLFFAFALITTIGYGNITPKTFAGQMFCIFFAAFGVPLTLLIIADLGKFISRIIFACNDRFNNEIKRLLRKRFKMIICYHKSSKLLYEENDNNEINGQKNNDDKQINGTDAKSEMSDDNEQSSRTLALLVLFFIYVIAGSLLLSSYEPEMPFFTAIYFSFITLTSIGLGDIVPQRRTYMAITILYITVGLALSTIAIEIAADTLKKLHYFRRQFKNVGNIEIWFGGKRLTVRQIIRNLCDQFNIPDTAMSGFNIGHFVEEAIKVEAGERPTLRTGTPRQEVNSHDENEFLTKVSVSCENESEHEHDNVTEHEPEPEHISESKFTSEEELKPESEAKSECESEVEVSEPEPIELLPEKEIPQCEPISVTPEIEPISEPELHPLELSKEVEIPYVPEIPMLTVLEPTSPLQSVLETVEVTDVIEELKSKQSTSVKPEEKSVEDLSTRLDVSRRKGYSEEAWKRYQEYQNEWSKFRRLSRTLSRSDRRKSAKKRSMII